MKYPVVYDKARNRMGVITEFTNVGYNLVLNDIHTANIQIPVDSKDNALCDLFHTVDLFDGDKPLGLFRIVGQPEETLSENKSVYTYSCEHAISYLFDDLIDGEYVMTGAAFTTRQAIEAVLAKQTTFRWQLGTCELNGNHDYTFENASVAEALFEIPKAHGVEYRWTYDTSTFPWTVNLLAISPTPASEARAGKNLLRLRRRIDTSELCTRLYCKGKNEEGEAITIASVNPTGKVYIDADTAAGYGIFADTYTEREETTPQKLYDKGLALLNASKHPAYIYSANIVDLFLQSGDAFDEVEIGTYTRLYDPKTKTDVATLVIGKTKAKVYDNPLELNITLSNVSKPYTSPVVSLARRVKQTDKTARSSENKAGQALTLAQLQAQMIADAEYQIGQAQAAIANAETRLNDAEALLEATSGVVEQNTLRIEQTETSLASKAEKSVVDTLEGTVSNHTTLISQNAEAIEQKAEKSVVDTLQQTVTDQGTTITQTAEAIEQKADKTVVDALEGTVSNHSTLITQNAEEIAQKASKSVVDALNLTVDNHSTSITQNAEEIAQKASKTSVDALTGRVSTAETTLTQKADGAELISIRDNLQAQITAVPGQISMAVSGGTNLLTGTDFEQGWGDWNLNMGDEVLREGSSMRQYKGKNLWITIPQNMSSRGVYRRYGGFEVGEKYTFSCYINTDYSCYLSESFGWSTTAISAGGGWKKVSLTFTATSTSGLLFILGNNSPTYAYYIFVDNVKLEKGTMATDWSPAPEDPASGVKTAGIEIGPGTFNSYASLLFDMLFGSGATEFGMSNHRSDLLALWTGGNPSNAKTRLWMDGAARFDQLMLGNSGVNQFTQMYPYADADNADPDNSMVFKIFIPSDCSGVQSLKLSFQLEAFRAYSKSASGGSGTVGGIVNPPKVTGYGDGSIGQHQHVITGHEHYAGAHTHPILYGIYKSTAATSCEVIVDGVNIGSFASLTARDITAHLAKTSGKVTRDTWHTIELKPNGLTRIVAQAFLVAVVATATNAIY